jgi:hypothetical protein
MLSLPWGPTPKGCGFFIPTLMPVELQQKMERDALRQHGRWEVHAGILNNTLGVLIVRVGVPVAAYATGRAARPAC